MESLIILFPIALTLGNCIMSSCIYQRLIHRIVSVEESLTTLVTQNISRQIYYAAPPHASAPPQPSAPPGYGYTHYPENNLNVV